MKNTAALHSIFHAPVVPPVPMDPAMDRAFDALARLAGSHERNLFLHSLILSIVVIVAAAAII